jgi:hypothetical protein
VDSETRPTEEEALELLEDARKPWPTLQDLLSFLTHPEEAEIYPGESPVAWLAAWYLDENTESGMRDAVAGGVLRLLESPGTNGGTLARAMAFVEAVKLEQAALPIWSLVASRKLTERRDGFSDLHGRALRALLVLGMIDPMQRLEEELPYGEYVPLAFAFVREKAKNQIASALLKIVHFPFFAEALRTVALAYSNREGIQILGEAARVFRKNGPAVTKAFLDAIPYLPLQWPDRDDLVSILRNEPANAVPAPTAPAPAVLPPEFAGMRGRSPGFPRQALEALRQVVVY